MMRYASIIVIILSAMMMVLIGCSNQPITDCPKDSVICSNGRSLTRNPNNDCSFPVCSDGRQYISGDPEQCAAITFVCEQGKVPFFDNQGCGCQIATNQTQSSGTVCTAQQRGVVCTQQYDPVCGWFSQDVQCIRNPCADNYSNACMACSDAKVEYWTKGACPELISNLQANCNNMGGRYLPQSKECEGVTESQCTRIGGKYDPCASACRNDPNATMCTLQCVQVCKFT